MLIQDVAIHCIRGKKQTNGSSRSPSRLAQTARLPSTSDSVLTTSSSERKKTK
jgi:hypothetical protein